MASLFPPITLAPRHWRSIHPLHLTLPRLSTETYHASPSWSLTGIPLAPVGASECPERDMLARHLYFEEKHRSPCTHLRISRGAASVSLRNDRKPTQEFLRVPRCADMCTVPPHFNRRVRTPSSTVRAPTRASRSSYERPGTAERLILAPPDNFTRFSIDTARSRAMVAAESLVDLELTVLREECGKDSLNELGSDVSDGLSQSPKQLNSKYLYDDAGSGTHQFSRVRRVSVFVS
jgi:hypothetical protein